MQTDAPRPSGSNPSFGRIEGLDLARGLALIAMASYHFTWDLEFFGYMPAGMTGVGGWKIYARCIASTFLLLAGVSLVLAHGNAIRWRGFLKRFAMVAGAAAAISVATYFAVPEGFIFFGILHQIALASLIGLAFLRLPWFVTALAAVAVVAAPHYLRSDVFNHPALWWIGLSTANPRSNDFVPLFPWFGAVLAGMALARFAIVTGIAARLAEWHPPGWSRLLRFGGRHSLAFYLLHQPLLIGSIWLFSQVFPAPVVPREVRFQQSCEQTCGQTRDTAFCKRYCGCMLETLAQDGAIEGVYAGDGSDTLRRQVADAAMFCTASTEDEMLQDPKP